MDIRAKVKLPILYVIILTIIISLFNFQTVIQADSTKSYIPAGIPFGISIKCEGLLVSGFIIDDQFTQSNNPAIQSGIKLGDRIVEANNERIETPQSLYDCISTSEGKEITLTVQRSTGNLKIKVKPKLCKEGEYRIGIHLKDTVTGIGTLTYYCPEDDTFGGLGHGICDSNTGEVIPISDGDVFQVKINGINKGSKGQAGEIRGNFSSISKGKILKNTKVGVFGKIESDFVSNKKPIYTAKKSDIETGEVTIISTLDEKGPVEYKARIEAVDFEKNYRNFVIKITDERLISKSGGIIQGMSGSPIVQNNKLIGAVTHVLVNDPTMGYGIFIENMINAS